MKDVYVKSCATRDAGERPEDYKWTLLHRKYKHATVTNQATSEGTQILSYQLFLIFIILEHNKREKKRKRKDRNKEVTKKLLLCRSHSTLWSHPLLTSMPICHYFVVLKYSISYADIALHNSCCYLDVYRSDRMAEAVSIVNCPFFFRFIGRLMCGD